MRAVGGGATVFRGFTPYINLFSVNYKHVNVAANSRMTNAIRESPFKARELQVIDERVICISGAQRHMHTRRNDCRERFKGFSRFSLIRFNRAP